MMKKKSTSVEKEMV